LAVILTVLGAVVGYSRGFGAVIVVAAMALLLALSAATARTLTTVLASGLTSRRGRDAMIVLVSVLALSFQLLRFLHVSADLVARLVDILRWLPPGMLGQAALDARDGRFGVALVQLVPAAILIPLLLRWWASALDRSMTVVSSGQTQRRPRTADRARPLVPNALGFLVGHKWGAVTARELRYVVRDPRRKVTLVNSLIIGVGLPVYLAVRSGGGDEGAKAVLVTTVFSYIAVLAASNQFGLDGAAAWMDMVAGDTMPSVLIGKNAAVALEVLPLVAVVGTGLAAFTGGWLYLPAAIVLSLAGLGVGLGTADVVSVSFPFRLPENRSPFAGSGGGQGCSTGLVLLGCALVQNVLLLPVVGAVAVAAFAGTGWLLVVVPVAAAYGVGLWLVGLRLAIALGRQRGPEILVKVDPARTG
jgi:ABC-2 type transport system permease protein